MLSIYSNLNLQLIFRFSKVKFHDIVNFTDLFELKIKNEKAKMAFFLNDMIERGISRETRVSGIKLNEKLITNSVSFVISRNNFIFELAELVIERLIQAGITKHLFEYQCFLEKATRVDEITIKNPEVLTINDLSFGFFIWLSACGVTLTVFLCEILFFLVIVKGRMLVLKIIGLVCFLRLLKQRLQVSFM